MKAHDHPGFSSGGHFAVAGDALGTNEERLGDLMLILASSPSSARVSSQLQLLTQAAFTLNRGLVEPKAKWTLPEPLKCSYFSIPWGKCWHGFPCPSWAETSLPPHCCRQQQLQEKARDALAPHQPGSDKKE